MKQRMASIDWRTFVLPPRPTSFAPGTYVPPPHFVKPLQERHAHPRDARIRFEELEHIYFWDGAQVSLSCTGFKKLFFAEFEADLMLQRMMTSRAWAARDAKYARYMRADGAMMTAAEVRGAWAASAADASARGTLMHWAIELYVNGMATYDDMPEMRHFMNWKAACMDPRGIEPYRTEWEVYANAEDLAGSIDFVGRAPGGFVIVDWKRSSHLLKMSRGESHKSPPAKGPLAHLPGDTLTEYYVQLNLYKYILENYYDMPIVGMYIVCLHEDADAYLEWEAPAYNDEMRAIMELRRNTLQSNRDGSAVLRVLADGEARKRAAEQANAAQEASNLLRSALARRK